jgi:hypothetical protein
MASLSLFQRVSESDLSLDPYPHVVIRNALPDELCEYLKTTYPSLQSQGVDVNANNYRWSTHAAQVDLIEGLHQVWRDFINFHTSQEFLDQVLNLFAEPLLRMYPRAFPSKEVLLAQRAQRRDLQSGANGTLMLDAQICGNTPVKQPGAPRGVHFDAPLALYGGLYYLRDDEDDSVGGDLQIWRWNPEYSYKKKSGEYRENVPAKHVQLVKTVRYESNTLVFFVNSINSLHSVTVRQTTPHTRKFVNLLADSNTPYFELTPHTTIRIRNAIRRRIKK